MDFFDEIKRITTAYRAAHGLPPLTAIDPESPLYQALRKPRRIPAPSHEAKWGNLCPTHRKPVMERDRRIEVVMTWAQANWEKLEPEALKADEAARGLSAQQYGAALHAQAQQMAAAQGMAASNPYGGLGCLGLLGL